jgi:hypothetical protein
MIFKSVIKTETTEYHGKVKWADTSTNGELFITDSSVYFVSDSDKFHFPISSVDAVQYQTETAPIGEILGAVVLAALATFFTLAFGGEINPTVTIFSFLTIITVSLLIIANALIGLSTETTIHTHNNTYRFTNGELEKIITNITKQTT